MTDFSNKTAAFDAIALDYDADFTQTTVGRLQREAVWQALQERLPFFEKKRALELNCGTGEDARWLAERGFQVVATDISEKMVGVARQKIERAGLAERVEFQVLATENLAALAHSTDGFDLVFSNFGGLNCLSPAVLEKIEPEIQRFLSNEGLFVAVVMSRFCLFETAYFLAKRNWNAAFRRRERGPVAARLDSETTIETWYFSPSEFAACFSSLAVVDLQPIGAFLPPSYLDSFFKKWPRVLGWLDFLEKKCRRVRFLASVADHFLIVFSKKTD